MFVRKEINSLTAGETAQFVACIQHMMIGGTKSQYYRLAGYHGYPGNYCAHGVEAFTSWHVLYLIEFEKQMDRSRVALGYKTPLGLPYWDWVTNPKIPTVFRTQLTALPKGFSTNAQIMRKFSRPSDATFGNAIRSGGIGSLVSSAMRSLDHATFSSTDGGPNSIENPHNSIHVFVGGQMSNVSYAAFDPIFWVHHANIDRYYISWMRANPMAVQQTQNNDTTHDPFVNSSTEDIWLLSETTQMIATRLPYTYQTFMQVPRSVASDTSLYNVNLLLAPIDIRKLGGKSCELHVFLFRGNVSADLPSGNFDRHKNHVGQAGIFARKTKCSNCEKRRPYTLNIDVSYGFNKLGYLPSEDLTIKILVKQELSNGFHKIIEGKDIGIKRWKLEYNPLQFISRELKLHSEGPQVKLLQQYLSTTHLYNVEHDGIFGPLTLLGVNKLQHLLNIPQNGVFDHNTWIACFEGRCSNSDAVVSLPRAPTTYTVIVKQPPKYIGDIFPDVMEALREWTRVAGHTFVFHGDHEQITIAWETIGDGKGGKLAYTSGNTVVFDTGDIFFTSDLPRVATELGTFSFKSVLMHELGHVFGYQHMANSIMSPFYEARAEILETDPVLDEV